MRPRTILSCVVVLAASGALTACGGSSETSSGGSMAADGAAAQAPVDAPRAADADAAGAVSKDGAVLRGTAERLTGGQTDLASFEGDVVLVVNTASQCGFTPQFADLQKLYAERRGDGFTILGFPSDSFNQELDDAKAISDVCEKNFGVEFPMFAETAVTGDDAHPLFKRLAAAAGQEPSWNFNKYLVDRKGNVVGHYDSGDVPVEDIDRLIAQKS